MQVTVPPLRANLAAVLNRLGYHENKFSSSRDRNFVRRLGSGHYPRFHLYVFENGQGIRLSLHLDQKQPSYEGTHAHGGEYEGQLVSEEIGRIDAYCRLHT